MRGSDAGKIAGRLAGDMTTVRVGERGVLLESLLDAENTDFLRLMAGLPPFGEPGADFSWSRAPADRAMIQLDQCPFAIRLSAPTPELLARGLNYLAETTDHVLGAVALEHSRRADGPEPAYPHEVQRRMRHLFATPPPGLPLGVRSHLENAPEGGALPETLSHWWQMRDTDDTTDAIQEHARNPEIQDHRPVIPVRSRGLR